MQSRKKQLVQMGDLVVYSRGKRLCLVLAVNPVLGSGFQSADVLWCNSGDVETVLLQYLKVIQKSDNFACKAKGFLL